MKYMAQRLKSEWEKHNKKYQNGEPTILGRLPLIEYIKHGYGKYTDLCSLQGAEPAPFVKWLYS